MTMSSGATEPASVAASGREELSDADFQLLRDAIRREVGISIAADKRALVIGRLRSLVAEQGHSDFASFTRELLRNPDPSRLSQLVDRIATNHTFFGREKEHFDFLVRQALPELCPTIEAQGERDLRVWCAAASTGEEPYVLAMLIRDFLASRFPGWEGGVLATDVSARALERARRGVYPRRAVERLDPLLRLRYFRERGADELEITPELKREVLFRRFNLMNQALPFRHRFHVVFCRNVMIYFDEPTRLSLVHRLHGCIEPGGYLFIGMAESLDRRSSPFQFVRPGIYRKAIEP